MRLARVMLTCFVVIGLVAGSVAMSPPTSVSAIGTRISTSDEDNSQYTAMAKNSTNGNLTAVWFADEGNKNFVLRASTSTNGGASWGNEVNIYLPPAGQDYWGVRVAYDSTGGLHVVYGFGSSSGRAVRYSYVAAGADPGNAANWQGNNASICGDGACLYPDVAVGNDGYFYVVYEDPDNQLHVRRRLGTSEAWSSHKVVSGGDRVQGSIAVGSDGKIHVTYLRRSENSIWYERYTSFDSFTQESKVQLSTSASASFDPDIVIGPGNVAHVAWEQSDRIYYSSVTGGTVSSPRSVSSSIAGRANLSIAVSSAGQVFVTYNDGNFRELWESTSADWDSPQKLAGEDPSARYQRYGVSLDGEVNLVLVEDNVVKYLLRQAGSRDTVAPTVSTASLAAPTTGQRAVATISGTDTADSGAPSGIVTIQYSLNGINYLTGATVAATASLSNFQFSVDLANPGAGGAWGGSSHTLRVRLIDAAGNIGNAVAAAPLSFPVPTVTVTRYLAEGYTGGTFDEYVTLANPSATDTIAVSLTFQYAGASSGTPGTLVVIAPNQRVTVSIDTVAGAGKELSIKLESDRQFFAERPMYFTNYPAALGLAYNKLGVSALSGITGGHLGTAANAPAPTWYFAEGYTGPGFEGYFTIQNPGNATATITITYFLAGGGSTDRIVAVGAGQRLTVVIHGAASQGGIGENQSFSARLNTSAGTPIIAERVQYFRYSGSMGAVTGGTATLGATAPATAWYFAEGYTGPGFDEYLTIQNPNATAGTATITYYVEGQSAPTFKIVNLLANSRTTVVVHDAAGGGLGRNLAHATTVSTTDLPGGIIVERPIYFLYTGPGLSGIDGGHNVMGATSLIAPNTSVVMAEGYTGTGFEQYLTFQNPNAAAIVVTITYLKADGTTVNKDLVLLGSQRTTVPVHIASGAGLGTGQEFSTKVTVPLGAAGGILVERVNYFRYNNVGTGGFAAFGRAS